MSGIDGGGVAEQLVMFARSRFWRVGYAQNLSSTAICCVAVIFRPYSAARDSQPYDDVFSAVLAPAPILRTSGCLGPARKTTLCSQVVGHSAGSVYQHTARPAYFVSEVSSRHGNALRHRKEKSSGKGKRRGAKGEAAASGCELFIAPSFRSGKKYDEGKDSHHTLVLPPPFLPCA